MLRIWPDPPDQMTLVFFGACRLQKEIQKRIKTSMELTRCIIRSKIEIAEFPVQYKTFKGFTNVKWRFFRGLRNAIEL